MRPDPIAALGDHFDSLDLRTSDHFDRELQIQLNEVYRSPAVRVDLRSLRLNAVLLFASSILVGSMGFSIASAPLDERAELPITRAEIISTKGE